MSNNQQITAISHLAAPVLQRAGREGHDPKVTLRQDEDGAPLHLGHDGPVQSRIAAASYLRALDRVLRKQ